eukprot:TRINITY_DN80_c0_g1_i2.p1 TRINITY_DN80_c0_g1~~TRINITY_DN80_c0_g1_i2.p1  ORF type:complete len:237 (+),score=92.68 TRINITY_DN80_c0_g1_i2:92-712(+)
MTSIWNYNGGAVLAMTGKDCFTFATDNRFGAQQKTEARNNPKLHQLSPTTFIGLAGLETDNQTLLSKIRYRLKMFKLKEERDMPVRSLVQMVSCMLYERRFGFYFVSPVIAGFDEKGKPYIAEVDVAGCPQEPEDFVCGGTCGESIAGLSESLWQPNMDPDALLQVTSQTLLHSLDRDCLSGWGATVRLITKDGKCRVVGLKTRMD